MLDNNYNSSPYFSSSKKVSNNLYVRKVADLFIKGIKENKVPWKRPWKPCANINDYNLFSMVKGGKFPSSCYKGLNGLLCELKRMVELNTDDPRWGTMCQLQDYNKKLKDKKECIYIKKGEHGLPIKFYSQIYLDNDGNVIDGKVMNGENCSCRTVMKTFTIFNACQMVKYQYDNEGNRIMKENGEYQTIPAFDKFDMKYENTVEPIDRVEKLIQSTGAKIVHTQENNCGYSVTEDIIRMVPRNNFNDSVSYYDTLLHELTHWTGNEKRLNRSESKNYNYNDKAKAKEEIIAEIGGYLLAKECNITYYPSDNNYSYTKSWLLDLGNNPEEVFDACKKAERAKNYIFDFERNLNKEKEKENVCENTSTKEKEKTEEVEYSR